MNIVAYNHESRELLFSKIFHFLEEFHVGRILKDCNGAGNFAHHHRCNLAEHSQHN